MEQGKELLEVGNGGGLESSKKGSEEYCSRCFGLESELEKKMSDIEELRRQIVVLQDQNDGLKSFQEAIKGSDEKDTQTTNGEKCVMEMMEEDLENDKVLELMIENKVLECEKKKAESDVGFWKAKCEELELRVKVLESNVVVTTPVVKTETVKEERCCDASTPLIHTSNGNERQEYGANEEILHEKRKKYSTTRTQKQLNFGEETPGKKMAPATPATGGLHPAMAGLIDISDDDDDDEGSSYEKVSSSGNRTLKDKGESEIEDDIITHHCYQGTPSLLASKRKRASYIVHSDDSESDDTDDNVPLHRLRKRHSNDVASVPQKHSSESKISNRGIPTTGSFTDDETESDSEGESLDGFIVSGSESDISGAADKSSSEGGDEVAANCNEKPATESEDKSEGNVLDYDEIMGMIGRRKKKGQLTKWEFEADMLAAFGKDPELCMKAVCALYRQQTSDEQSCKATIHQNQRGFSQCDALRGSKLGEFLTDGDPEGGLKKSVEELREFQPKGLDLCITLATHYSKQLFAMYENGEDPLWPALITDS